MSNFCIPDSFNFIFFQHFSNLKIRSGILRTQKLRQPYVEKFELSEIPSFKLGENILYKTIRLKYTIQNYKAKIYCTKLHYNIYDTILKILLQKTKTLSDETINQAPLCVYTYKKHHILTLKIRSPCQSSVNYGNTKIAQHALKVPESS